MKCLIILTTVLLVLCIVEAGPFSSVIRGLAKPCKKQERASHDDVDKIGEGEVPQTTEGKCLAACLLEQFGILTDNKLNKEGVKSKMLETVHGEEKKKSVEQLVDTCAAITNDDRCEGAAEIWECMKKGGEKLKLKMFGI